MSTTEKYAVIDGIIMEPRINISKWMHLDVNKKQNIAAKEKKSPKTSINANSAMSL